MVYARPIAVRAGMGRPTRRRPSDSLGTIVPGEVSAALSAAVRLAVAASAALSVHVDAPPATGGDLAWDAVAGATGYRVYWGATSGPPYSNSADVGNAISVLPADIGIAAGTWYTNVRSYDESGLEGPWAAEIAIAVTATEAMVTAAALSAAVKAAQSASAPLSLLVNLVANATIPLSVAVRQSKSLSAPLSVQVNDPSGAAGDLSWDAVANATGYKVYWGTVSGPPYANSANVGNVTSASPAAIGMTGTGTRYVNIRSYDASGLEGPWGAEITITL